MKVACPAQSFRATVATAIEFMIVQIDLLADAINTAEFVHFMNSLFDMRRIIAKAVLSI